MTVPDIRPGAGQGRPAPDAARTGAASAAGAPKPARGGGPEGAGALLAVRGLRVAYGETEVVRGVDFEVLPGETVALVGESGSGKSTTAHALVGLLPAGGRHTAGRILFDGEDLATAPERRLRERRGRDIGLVPQDPMVALNPVQRVGRQVAEALLVHRLATRREARERAVELLGHAGLPDPETTAVQYPHELSGGMRQRALIAVALAAGPRLLIADEPTSALDVTVQRQILDHLERLARESGTALLLITHDLGVAADRAARTLVMSQGELVEHGPTREVLVSPRHPYTRRLLAAAPSLAGPTAATVTGRAPGGPAAGTARAEPADRRGQEAAGDPGHDPAGTAAAADPERALLRVEGLVKDFPLPRATGRRTLRAVAGVDFHVARGETFALVGESGSGKSTTARIAVGLARPTAGRVRVDGQDLAELRPGELRRLRRRMQIVYQTPYSSLDPRYTVAELIGEPLRAFRTHGRRERARRAAELLDQVALPGSVLRRRPPELSGGQRQRVALARALALEPDLVVCDEPVSALDVSVQAQILTLLATLQRELGLACLFISHDLAVVRQIAHRVGVMRRGRLVETGTAERLFAAPTHPYTRQLLAAIPGRRARDRERP